MSIRDGIQKAAQAYLDHAFERKKDGSVSPDPDKLSQVIRNMDFYNHASLKDFIRSESFAVIRDLRHEILEGAMKVATELVTKPALRADPQHIDPITYALFLGGLYLRAKSVDLAALDIHLHAFIHGRPRLIPITLLESAAEYLKARGTSDFPDLKNPSLESLVTLDPQVTSVRLDYSRVSADPIKPWIIQAMEMTHLQIGGFYPMFHFAIPSDEQIYQAGIQAELSAAFSQNAQHLITPNSHRLTALIQKYPLKNFTRFQMRNGANTLGKALENEKPEVEARVMDHLLYSAMWIIRRLAARPELRAEAKTWDPVSYNLLLTAELLDMGRLSLARARQLLIDEVSKRSPAVSPALQEAYEHLAQSLTPRFVNIPLDITTASFEDMAAEMDHIFGPFRKTTLLALGLAGAATLASPRVLAHPTQVNKPEFPGMVTQASGRDFVLKPAGTSTGRRKIFKPTPKEGFSLLDSNLAPYAFRASGSLLTGVGLLKG